jgi:hypothetical protein
MNHIKQFQSPQKKKKKIFSSHFSVDPSTLDESTTMSELACTITEENVVSFSFFWREIL